MAPQIKARSTPKTIFLKLGGSLITDKSQPRTPRREVLTRLAQEIAAAIAENPDLRLVLGHGSGSFGHVSGQKYSTREGVRSPEEWSGFAEVWFDASHLNHLVMEALHDAHIPALSFPPSTTTLTKARDIIHWDTTPLERALHNQLLPVVHGDVVFDKEMGGTILSTEEVFSHLANELHPQKILLAGQDPGVWADYPQCTEIIPEITPKSYPTLDLALQDSETTDVTGGMAGKVREMVALVKRIAGVEVWIFSGQGENNVYQALLGRTQGTHIHNQH